MKTKKQYATPRRGDLHNPPQPLSRIAHTPLLLSYTFFPGCRFLVIHTRLPEPRLDGSLRTCSSHAEESRDTSPQTSRAFSFRPLFLTPVSRVDSLEKDVSADLSAAFSSPSRPRRLARPRTPPFHGDNTGSNPVGDANKINKLDRIQQLTLALYVTRTS